MLYAVAFVPLVVAANNAEVSTSNIRKGAAFENIKASWGKALKIGDFTTNLNCRYDYNDNRDFLKDCSLSGNIKDDDDLKVRYDLSHNFKGKNTEVSLSAESKGTTLSAEYDTDSKLKEVSLHRDVDVGDQKLSLTPAWMVQAKSARIKMMSALGGGDVSAQVDYDTEGKSVEYELGYARSLEKGKDVKAVFTPKSKELEVEYVDNKFEDGATWTATATVPLDGDNNVLDASKLTLKRSWNW